MINTLYTATTGLEGFSKGLSVISENVANLNTTGFKQQRLTYFDLGEGDSSPNSHRAGDGMYTGDPYRQYAQGDIRQSDNSLDSAIRGAGFFVVKEGDNTLLTRAGQFTPDSNGVLKMRDTDAIVQGLSGGELVPISIADFRTNPPVATTRVTFNGTVGLAQGGTEVTVADFSIFDTAGNPHIVKVTLTKVPATPSGREWNVNVKIDGVSWPMEFGPLRYEADNITPNVEFSVFSGFTYRPTPNSEPVSLILDFSKTRYIGDTAGSMTASADGYTTGNLSQLIFDERGVLKATYTNGQKADIAQLALANTFELEKMRAVGKNMFSMEGLTDVSYGRPGADGLGALAGSSIEASNVELTSQFSELIITQRAYQASSQVITTTNEMLSVLFEIKGRR